jgi:hypothetical protein
MSLLPAVGKHEPKLLWGSMSPSGGDLLSTGRVT